MLSHRWIAISLYGYSTWTSSQGLQPTYPEGLSLDTPVIGPLLQFKTEPNFQAALINIKTRHPDLTSASPGHFFFTLSAFEPVGNWGPQIFDQEGNLIFFNDGLNPRLPTQDAHVCDFEGSIGQQLCIGDVGDVVRGRWLTSKLVYNNRYEQVAKFFNQGLLDLADGHEYNMLPGGRSFLQPVYQRRAMDISSYGGPEFGTVFDACFQEIDVSNGQELYHWCYLDHQPIDETYIYLNTASNTVNLTSSIAGFGTSDYPWDFLHINSIDKNEEGDYLVSARHLDQILKIAGPENIHGVSAGEIIWKLGGKRGDFKVPNVLFSRQHHARYVKTGSEETIITLFDNAWEGQNPSSAAASSAKFIAINNSTMQAHISIEFVHPDKQLSLAQGSMQVLPNNNVFVNWGWTPQISEFSPLGDLLFHAQLTDPIGHIQSGSYRGYKSPWAGFPTWPPKLIAYSRTCQRSLESPLVVYVSWNGATEVKTWRFYVSISDVNGPWISAGSRPKKGFETGAFLLDDRFRKHIPLPFIRYVMVQGLDAENAVLGKTVSPTFVPGYPANERMCDGQGCFEPSRFSYGPEFNSADLCGRSRAPAFIAFLFVVIMIEVMAYFAGRLFFAWLSTYEAQTTSNSPTSPQQRCWNKDPDGSLPMSFFLDKERHTNYHDMSHRESCIDMTSTFAGPFTMTGSTLGEGVNNFRNAFRYSSFSGPTPPIMQEESAEHERQAVMSSPLRSQRRTR